MVVPRRSFRLAKKAFQHMLVVAAAQNVLMHKMELATGQ
jgi:hypothetical protein